MIEINWGVFSEWNLWFFYKLKHKILLLNKHIKSSHLLVFIYKAENTYNSTNVDLITTNHCAVIQVNSKNSQFFHHKFQKNLIILGIKFYWFTNKIAYYVVKQGKIFGKFALPEKDKQHNKITLAEQNL